MKDLSARRLHGLVPLLYIYHLISTYRSLCLLTAGGSPPRHSRPRGAAPEAERMSPMKVRLMPDRQMAGPAPRDRTIARMVLGTPSDQARWPPREAGFKYSDHRHISISRSPLLLPRSLHPRCVDQRTKKLCVLASRDPGCPATNPFYAPAWSPPSTCYNGPRRVRLRQRHVELCGGVPLFDPPCREMVRK